MMEMSFESIEEDAKMVYENFQRIISGKIFNDKSYIDESADAIVSRMIEELTQEVVGDVYRSIKLGYSDIVFSRIYDQSLDKADLPFYPENEDSKTEDINCPKCHKLIHASRFAPHLEKCMQQGRSSSRIASQRIANNSKDCSYASSGYGSDGDDEWKAEKSRSVKKGDNKKKKDSARKQKTFKAEVLKNQRESLNNVSPNIKDVFQSPGKPIRENYSNKSSKDQEGDVWISPNKVLPLADEKVAVMSPRCGVKSDHTGKYCSRSLRCPLHSDAERAVARKMLAENMDVDVEDMDYSKSVIGSFSQLDITPSTPSKKKEKQKHSIPKY